MTTRNCSHLLALAALADLVALAALVAPARAQSAVQTLAALGDRAQIVVKVQVLACSPEGAARHQVRFARDELLKGSCPEHFVLTEEMAKGNRICGSALHHAHLGQGYLAFLDRDQQGPGNLRLAVASHQALLESEPLLEAYVRRLVKTSGRQGKGTGTADRLSLFTTGLASKNRRIREDAALSLLRLPGLQQASQADRQRILEALPRALEQQTPGTVDLLQVALRLQLDGAMDLLLPGYLLGKHAALDDLLLEILPRLGADRLARRISRPMTRSARGQRRAVRLLSRCPGAAARQSLLRLSRSKNRPVAVEAVASLLQSAASPEELRELRGLVPEEVLTSGQELARERQPDFRSIRPRARPGAHR